MEVAVSKKLLTVDEYYKMAEVGILKPTDRVELINGEIIEKMSPVGSKHASIVKRLNALLNKLLSEISIQDPVKLNATSQPEPDIAILKPRKDDYANAHPGPEDVMVILEVSDSTIDYYQNAKNELYASAGIPAYWIVNIPENQIEVYTRPLENGFLERKIYDQARMISLLDRSIPVDQILK